MSDKSNINWTDATWNPITGCAKVSAACKHCYAERDWARLSANPKTVYYKRKFTDVQCHPERLDQPLRWTRPRKIFVNSMSDLFHPDVPDAFIDQVFAVMGLNYVMRETSHIFQILTKRPARMQAYLSDPDTVWRVTRAMKALGPKGGLPGENSPPTWPLPNVWVGVSVEDQAAADERVPLLLGTPAAVRWISAEPLLEQVSLKQFIGGIEWLVVGGESGSKARPMHPEWARSLRDECKAAGVPFWFKQWGAWMPQSERLGGAVMRKTGKGEKDDLLDGEVCFEAPTQHQSLAPN